jgi:hypothetical protein
LLLVSLGLAVDTQPREVGHLHAGLHR